MRRRENNHRVTRRTAKTSPTEKKPSETFYFSSYGGVVVDCDDKDVVAVLQEIKLLL